MEPIRVLLVDNEEVFRQGLAKLIEDQPHMRIVYQGGDAHEALIKAEQLRPDVVLIDSQTAETDVASLITDIIKLSPEAKVALFARDGSDVALVDTVKAGARACLAKSISAADLVKSIELVSSGRIIISPEFAEKFLKEITPIATPEAHEAEHTVLSQRELEIVQQVALGASNKEIAAKLIIAENTVKVHVKNILNKLELRNRQQLVAYAVLRNWVTLESKLEGEGAETKT